MGSVRDDIGSELRRQSQSGQNYSDEDYLRLHRIYCTMSDRVLKEARAAIKCAVEEGLKDGDLPALQSTTVIKLHSIIQIVEGKR